MQNTAPRGAVGAATATNSFFREIGVALGSALVGALFTARLGALLAGAGGRGRRAGAPSPPPWSRACRRRVREAVAAAYTDALTPVFALLVPVVLVSSAALLLVREVPLATDGRHAGVSGWSSRRRRAARPR